MRCNKLGEILSGSIEGVLVCWNFDTLLWLIVEEETALLGHPLLQSQFFGGFVEMVLKLAHVLLSAGLSIHFSVIEEKTTFVDQVVCIVDDGVF